MYKGGKSQNCIWCVICPRKSWEGTESPGVEARLKYFVSFHHADCSVLCNHLASGSAKTNVLEL